MALFSVGERPLRTMLLSGDPVLVAQALALIGAAESSLSCSIWRVRTDISHSELLRSHPSAADGAMIDPISGKVTLFGLVGAVDGEPPEIVDIHCGRLVLHDPARGRYQIAISEAGEPVWAWAGLSDLLEPEEVQP